MIVEARASLIDHHGNRFYFTNAADEVVGPSTTLQLMAHDKEGTLTDTSLVCTNGSSEWGLPGV